MAIRRCDRCGDVDAKREVGIGTLLLVVLTGLWWLVAIPFYQKRCPLGRAPTRPAPYTGGSTRI